MIEAEENWEFGLTKYIHYPSLMDGLQGVNCEDLRENCVIMAPTHIKYIDTHDFDVSCKMLRFSNNSHSFAIYSNRESNVANNLQGTGVWFPVVH